LKERNYLNFFEFFELIHLIAHSQKQEDVNLKQFIDTKFKQKSEKFYIKEWYSKERFQKSINKTIKLLKV